MPFFLRRKERIRSEAASWASRLGGEPSEEDLLAFGRWRDRDPRHGEAYDRMIAIWAGAARLSRPVPAPDPGPRLRPAFAAVAGLTLLGAAAIAALLASLNPPPTAILSSSYREGRHVRLADGSSIAMEPGSSARASIDGAARRIELVKGGMQFRVANGASPLIVEAAGRTIVSSEGRFEVVAGEGETLILPLEGVLEVRPSGLYGLIAKPDQIGPGQRMVISGGKARIETVEARASEPAAAMIELDGTTLGEAAELVNAASPVKIRLASERVGRMKVSGAYRAGDATGFASAVAVALSLDLERLPGGDLLLKDGAQQK